MSLRDGAVVARRCVADRGRVPACQCQEAHASGVAEGTVGRAFRDYVPRGGLLTPVGVSPSPGSRSGWGRRGVMAAKTRAPFHVTQDGVNSYGPGKDPVRFMPGDFILTHGDALVSKLIRFGQGIRIHGKDRK